MKVALFVLFVVACVSAQAQNAGDVEVVVIDNFLLGQGQEVRILSMNPPETDQESYSAGSGCSGLLGCVRDMSLEVFTSLPNRYHYGIITSNTIGSFDGSWEIVSPKTSTSNYTLQYDGTSGFSNPPATTMSADLTGGLSNPYFFLSIYADFDGVVEITVRDGQSQVCTEQVNYLELYPFDPVNDLEDTYYYVNFQDFSCDMTDITSVELTAPFDDAIDFSLYRFSVYGSPPPSPTPSPSPPPPPVVSELIIIDDFSLGQGQEVRIISSSPPETDQESYSAGSGCSGLLGCVRDMSIEVFSAYVGRNHYGAISSNTIGSFDGSWEIANPKSSTSNYTLQYDGTSGFSNPPANTMSVDLTGGSSNPYFFLSIYADLDAVIEITVRDGQSQVCTEQVNYSWVGYSPPAVATYYDVDFQNFSCDMTDITSVELTVPCSDGLDLMVARFSVYGSPPPSATPTPSRTPLNIPSIVASVIGVPLPPIPSISLPIP